MVAQTVSTIPSFSKRQPTMKLVIESTNLSRTISTTLLFKFIHLWRKLIFEVVYEVENSFQIAKFGQH